MKSIKAELDWNTADVVSIQQYLAGYDKGTTIYPGDFTADWLLSDIHSTQWVVKTAKTVTTDDDRYRYVKTFNWQRKLPDGSSLDSPENCHFLRFLQKAIFIIIESSAIAPNTSVSSLGGVFNSIVPFAQWAFREDMEIYPRSDFLNRLTQERLFCYIQEKVHGGIMATFGAPEIFKKRLLELSGIQVKSTDVYRLSESDRKAVIKFLSENNLYIKKATGDSVIDRNKFIYTFNFPAQITHSDKFTVFLRQFEEDLLQKNPDLLLPVTLEYEYPGHTTPLISDVISQPENHKRLISDIKTFLSTKSFFNQELPDSDRFKFSELETYIQDNQLKAKHTPWIPLPTCLKLINHATDWVLNKGQPIIDAMIDVYDTLYANDLLVGNNNYSESHYDERKKLSDRVLGAHQNEINVSDVHYKLRDHSKLRSNPPLTYLVDILRGACLIIIASMKPIRINELTSLKYNCLYFKENDGFWLMQDIEKSGVRGILPEDAKPIPKIAAKAITLLQQINDHARAYCPSGKEEGYLLYGLHYGSEWTSASIGDSEFIRQRLSWFCDHIETPLDQYGRRWYVNTHELRKSFLLNFFWTYKFSSLDSARWMAGHSDPDHIFEYIQSNFEGEEMVEVESEYAYQQLRIFREGNQLSDISNIEQVYDDVCNHFGVSSVSEIKEDELRQWLEIKIASGEYEITVYGIENIDQNTKTDIAIKIS